MPWNNNEESLHNFFSQLNSCHDFIKFIFHYLKASVNFLAVNVEVKHHKVFTLLYGKSTFERQL